MNLPSVRLWQGLVTGPCRPLRAILLAATVMGATLLAAAVAPGPAAAGRTERVVLVVIDGLRYSEGLGDASRTWVPRMASLEPLGSTVQTFQNDGYTYTSRAIPAIWCGAWTPVGTFSDPACGGSDNSYSEMPTIFEYFRKELSRPAADCIYVMKDLCSWKASFDPAYGPDYWPLYHEAGDTDVEVFEQAKALLAGQHPTFMLLYLADVDHAGHTGVWSTYTRAISVADSLVGVLWTTLQADPVYAGRTTMIVTNDHGRHTSNFRTHGDSCAGCRAIQLLAVGPDIRTGFVSTIPRAIPDIAPTIGALLGFSTPLATGTAMTELIQAQTGVGDVGPAPAPPGLQLQVNPNPVRRSTEVRFTLKSAGAVSLVVHDSAGRLVARILAREMKAGEHAVRWDGRGLDRERLASGLYFVTLTAPEGAATRRVVLLP